MEWAAFVPQFILHNYERFFGKIDSMNVGITALPWTFIGSALLIAQAGVMIFLNKFYAEGNALLLGIQAFSIVMYFHSVLLSWNIEFYLYNIVFRIWRYICLGVALVFNIGYFISVVNLLELINANTELEYDWEKNTLAVVDSDLGADTTWAVYELLMAMVTSYMDIYMSPIFVSCFVILAKEATLKQTAFSLEEDYKSGEFYDMFDIDTLSVLGLHTDEEYFTNGLKSFMQEYV